MPHHRTLSCSAEDDLARNTLSQIPTLFGRLEYLSSLRISHSGFYRHDGLAAIHGEWQSAKALRHAHEVTFVEWLKLPLAQKLTDLEQAPADSRLTDRPGLEKYYVPRGASAAERSLFLCEMEILMAILASQKCPD